MRSIRAALALALALAAASCQTRTVDPPGALLRLAVLPVVGRESSDLNELHFSDTPEQFRTNLIKALRERNAATEILATANEVEARDEGADIYIRPRISRRKTRLSIDGLAEYERLGDKWWISSALWFLTMIGGNWFEDADYKIGFDVRCEFGNARKLQAPFAWMNAGVHRVGLSYWERTWPSLEALQVLVLPPPITLDNVEKTSESLTEKITASVADQIDRFLRQEFEERALDYGDGSIEIRSLEMSYSVPADASSSSKGPNPDARRLTLDVSCRESNVQWVRVMRRAGNGKPAKNVFYWTPADENAEQSELDSDGYYRLHLPMELPSEVGDFTFTISASGLREFSRTFRTKFVRASSTS